MLLRDETNDDQERLANVEDLITAAKQFAAEDSSRTIGDFLENVTLASDLDSWDERQDCVSIMTLHAAKGLEFPVVYMAAVEQGLLPHERSIARSDELEEERRLAFVGMTRAKEELYLTHARSREFRGQTVYPVESMFFRELPEEAIEHIDLSSGQTRFRRKGFARFFSTRLLHQARKAARSAACGKSCGLGGIRRTFFWEPCDFSYRSVDESLTGMRTRFRFLAR